MAVVSRAKPRPSRKRGQSRERKRVRKANMDVAASHRSQALLLSVVDPEGAATIHRVVLKILQEVGVIVEHTAARKMLIQAGCQQKPDGYVRMPPDLVEHAISSVPDRIVLYDQNGNVRVDTSQSVTSYCPGHNCVRTLDYQTGQLRPGTLEDIKRTAIVSDKLPNLDMVCALGYPTDVPAEDEAAETMRLMLEYCSKPAAILAHDELIQKRTLGLVADACGGWSNLADKPIILELMGPVSPLKLPDEFCTRLINCARWGIPVVCYSATFPGMSCPITTAGAIAQSSAEALAGIVIHQLTEPGSPVMSGSAVLPMDMRQADVAYGSPEYMLTGLGAADYFSSIGIPSWVGAGCSDSHDFDTQAAAEAGANLAIAALAKTSFVHNLGYLSGGRTGSIELLVLCDELIGWVTKMAAGCSVDDEAIAYEVVRRAAPDNSYLTDQHTQNRYLTENWLPNLFERSDSTAWLEQGGVDLRGRIRQKLDDLLS